MSEGLRDISGMDHNHFMQIAIKEAKEAGLRGDRPIGAIIAHDGKIIAKGSSRYFTKHSDVDHAENIAVISCAPYLQKHGSSCVIYSTVEPCIMCISTIAFADIRNIVFAIRDEHMKTGENINRIPYLKQRVFNYIPDICRNEALAVFRQFSTDEAYRIVTTGKR